jgi:AcrR family transcriptional regulator
MTFSTYGGTVSELLDRRARKKAQTREQIRGIAHRLFAERGFDNVPIADIARDADVAVQTVFNHFATKEELFFDGRVPWVDGPAAAVRSRNPSVPPLTALRSYLIDLIGSLVASMGTAERRCYIATVEASETLRAHERELVFETERRLAAALTEAWSDPTAPDSQPAPKDPATAAALTAAVWLSAGRVLVVEQRPRIGAGSCPQELAARVEALAAGVLGQFESTAVLTDAAPAVERHTHTGWPPAAQRAG